MTTFDKREEAFEKQFALDEEQKFKAVARRNKLFGLWVAEKLGKSGDDAWPMPKSWSRRDRRRRSRRRPQDHWRSRRQGHCDRPKPRLRAKLDELTALAAAQVKAGT